MAFDPSKFQSKTFKEKALPVLLLLDVSGSMQGEKIESLHAAVQEMAADFVRQGVREINIKIAVITFGASVDCPSAAAVHGGGDDAARHGARDGEGHARG